MGVTWTGEQKTVIELRDCNILVSAAAGSGKTAVLVERILSKLTDLNHPVDIDHLLIVTFTNAAAGEMRERIREALEQKLEEEELDPRIREHLIRQTSLLQNAQITTIHSFCQYVIRNHFHTIDLDPGFRIADEGEQKLLRNDVLESLLEEQYGEDREEFQKMAEQFAPGRDDKELAGLIQQLYDFSMSFPWPREWLRECKKAYEPETEEEFLESDWVQRLMELVKMTLRDVRDQVEELLRISVDGDGPYMYEEALKSDWQMIDDLLRTKDYGACSQRFEWMENWARLSAKKDDLVSERKREQVKEGREQYKKTVKDLREQFFYAPAEEMFHQMRLAAPGIEELLDLTGLFAERFAEEKRKKNLMDFNDLEHFALKILVNREGDRILKTPVAQDFADHYEEIMIDEYQDSNLVQEMILTSISGMEQDRYNLFMVGDVKQSIYRFRLARPELFMEKYRTYSMDKGKCRRVDLHKNFRSRDQVLSGVNFIFEQIMEEQLGGVQYDEAAALYPGAVFEPSPEPDFYETEVLLVETDREEADEVDETSRELEARAVGKRILEMVGKEPVRDKKTGTYRPAEFGDMVILLRSVSGWAEVFRDVLGKMGIPACTGSRTGYFSALEIQTVLSFLKVLDNPKQDVPLTAVLHSPIVGLSGKELADIRSRHPDVPYCQACMEEESLKDFFAMVSELRQKAVYLPTHELLWEIYDRTGYGMYASAMPGGEQRKANLDMLVEKAIAFEAGSYRGLYNFIRYIENLHKYDVDFGEASVETEEAGSVRIMSIHKSKGLEFPIVFVSALGKRFNQSDARASLVFHGDLGVGCDCTDPILRTRTGTLFKELLKTEIKRETLGEELRVLYVALTRAKEKLILTGTVPSLEERLKKWTQNQNRRETVLPVTLRSAASSYLDWIIPALVRNRCFEAELKACEWMPDVRSSLWNREIYVRICPVTVEDLIGEESRRRAECCMTREELEHFPEDAVVDETAADYLKEQFGFSYPFAGSRDVPSKVSVSELKKLSQASDMEEGAVLYEEPVPVPLIPEFLKKEREVSAASRGTIYHRFMECVDLSEVMPEKLFTDSGQRNIEKTQLFDKIKQQLAKMTERGQLTEEDAKLLDRKKLERFFLSSMAFRMAKADRFGNLFRERQFVLEMDAAAMEADWPAGERILIQGIIDAYFIEDDEIVLLDYKTDSVKFQEASSLFEKYRVQLDYYEKALERLTGKRVKEKYIYSFCLNRVLADPDPEG